MGDAIDGPGAVVIHLGYTSEDPIRPSEHKRVDLTSIHTFDTLYNDGLSGVYGSRISDTVVYHSADSPYRDPRRDQGSRWYPNAEEHSLDL